MNKSDSIKNVMTAIGSFQAKSVKIRKDATNPHFKSKYASLSAILDEIQPILTECKLVFTQIPEDSKHLTTIIYHTESGEFIECRYDLNAVSTTPQAIGSAITYARRYSITSILGLNIDDDDDGNAANSKPTYQQQQPTRQASPPQQQAPAAPAKKPCSDAQFAKMCARIQINGELGVYEKAVETFNLTPGQHDNLREYNHMLFVLEEAIKLPCATQMDLSTLIIELRNERQAMAVHVANADMLAATPLLMQELNDKIKQLKA